jgi:glycosyltransferase involved in cell wall biosynthesis
MNDRVSVIVPTLNNAALVERTLQSVEDAARYLHAQPEGAGAEVEVVVVDDGSTDGTRAVVEAFTRGRERYQVLLRDRPSSPSCTRNTGVAASSGALLFFLDGDDVFLERHLYECVRLLKAQPEVDFVKTGVALSDPVHADWRARIGNSLVLNLCVRRRCHEFVGGFPDEHLFHRDGDRFRHEVDIFRMFEDVFYNKLLAAFFQGRGIPEETVRYYRHPGNSFDVQYAKFQEPAGAVPVERSEADRLRLALCRTLIDHQIEVLKRRERP